MEQRAVIRFLRLKGLKAKAVQAELQSVYGQMPANSRGRRSGARVLNTGELIFSMTQDLEGH
jgi:Mn-containing catalase